MEAEIQGRYEITIGPRLGPGANAAKEGRALNRVIRWCDDRIEYEADPRQTERLIADCGLLGAKSVSTPGTRPTPDELAAEENLKRDLQTTYRAASARCNYVSSDRPDAQFACKEGCRWMS